MKKTSTIAQILVAMATFASSITAQTNRTPATPTIASVMDAQLTVVESQFVPAAEAMPEDRYSFAPKDGEFTGVRTFAQEVKHVATANFAFYSAILGQELPPGVSLAGATHGPDDIRTKEQIMKYLKASFALGHQACAALTEGNSTAPLPKPPISFMNTRLSLATFSLVHASDHYGQITALLRMNGIVPPASKGQAPANPGTN